MKTLLKILLMSGLVFYSSIGTPQTVDCKIFKDGVIMKDGKVYSFDKTGALILLEEEKELGNGIKIGKTGDYKTAASAKAKLKNGEILTSKGELLLLAELIVKIEGVLLKEGKPYLLKDGTTTLVENPVDFGDGLKAGPDGTVTLKDGSSLMLKEGEMITPKGELVRKKDDIFTMDGVAIRGGKAMKWDQGRYVPLTADMNLGTAGAKVSPAGVVTNKDGSSIKLNEGAMINSKGEMAFTKSDLITDGVFKRDGKMMLMEKGKISPMAGEYLLASGKKISLDGNLVFSDSEKMALREGEFVLPSGEILLLKAGKVDAKTIDERKTTDHYIFRGGKMMLVKDGEPQILQQDISFSNGSKLLKHGHVSKKDGTKHILKEGEKIDMDGNFIVDKSKSDFDEKNHFVLKQGKMMQVKDGKEFPLLQEYLLPDWSKIYPDGTYEKHNGIKTKLKEGERLNTEGESMSKINTGYVAPPVTASTNKTPTTTTPTTPTQTLIAMMGGKLIIQMGAKEVPMSKERMLNNGTKIALDGTVSRKDGSSFKMKEGDKIDYTTGEPVK